MSEYQRIEAEVFKALAHPTRLKILEKLKVGPCCVCKIIPYVGGEQSNVSHHLAILKKAGIVKSEKRGSWMWYKASDRVIFKLLDLVNKFVIKNLREKQTLLKGLSKTTARNV